MAFPPYLLNTGFIRTRQVILSGLYIRVPRFSVRRTRRDAESGKAIKASPAGRCAGLDRPSLASGKKSSRATDEETSGGGSVTGNWDCILPDSENLMREELTTETPAHGK